MERHRRDKRQSQRKRSRQGSQGHQAVHRLPKGGERRGERLKKEEGAEEMIVGRNPVAEALRAGRLIHKIWLAEGVNLTAPLKELQSSAKERGILVQRVPRAKLDRLVPDTQHQGIVASVAAHAYHELEELLAQVRNAHRKPFFLVLEEVEDPHNLGSLLRTGDAVGIDGVIIPQRRAVGLTATVAKASTGAMEYVPVVRVVNIGQTLDRLKRENIWIAGADAEGAQVYTEVDYDLPIALVLGSEGQGLSRLVKEKTDFLVRLPMVGHVNSLNVSVAGALMMYEVFRHRRLG